jgi:hypothetical protein
MLGIFLIYWIGKRYYSLAHDYEKSPWPYAILAIGIYYGSQLLFGVILGLVMPEVFSGGGSDIGINLFGIAVGLLVWWIVYEIIKRKWENAYFDNYESTDDEIAEIGSDVH